MDANGEHNIPAEMEYEESVDSVSEIKSQNDGTPAQENTTGVPEQIKSEVGQSEIKSQNDGTPAQENTTAVPEQIKSEVGQRKTNEVENLEYLNQCLDGLVQYLHDHVVSGAESSPRTIAQLAEMKPESSIAKRYQHAHDICERYTKVENDIKELQDTTLAQEIFMSALYEYVTTKKPNISLDVPNDIQLDPRFALKHGQATRIAQEFEKKERELSESKQEMQEMANKIKEYKQNYEKLRAEHQNLETTCVTLQKRCNDANAQLLGFKKDMEEKAKEYQQKYAKQEKSKTEAVAKLKMTEQALNEKSVTYKTLQANHETLQRDYTKVVNQLREVNREKSILEDTTRKMQYRISCLQQEKIDMDDRNKCMIEKQNHEITYLREAEQSLLTRLSKIAGDRFTHDNVNIADLSDADRPTKLSETYSELYDNEWTDAFEELTENMKLSDEAAIRLLLKILMNAFRKCKEVTWDRYESLKLVARTLEVKQEKRPPIITEEKQHAAKTDETTNGQNEDQNKEAETTVSNQIASEHAAKTDETTNGQNEDQNKEAETTVSNQIASEHAVKTDETTKDQNEDKNKEAETTVSNQTASEHAAKTDETTKDQNEDQNKEAETTVSNQIASEYPAKSDEASNDQDEDQNKVAESKVSNPATLEICLQPTIMTSEMSIDHEKSLKNIWRTTTINLKDESLKLLCANLLTCLGKPETEMPKTSKYITCCTELCWKMGVQEKPMHLDVNAEKQVGEEKQFDTDKFRAYTKTGKSVAYVVWPAMFLHEGGAMLAKGIAQGCQKRVSSKE